MHTVLELYFYELRVNNVHINCRILKLFILCPYYVCILYKNLFTTACVILRIKSLKSAFSPSAAVGHTCGRLTGPFIPIHGRDSVLCNEPVTFGRRLRYTLSLLLSDHPSLLTFIWTYKSIGSLTSSLRVWTNRHSGSIIPWQMPRFGYQF